MTNPIHKSDDEQLSIRRVYLPVIQSLKLTPEEIVKQLAMQISPAHVESDPPQRETTIRQDTEIELAQVAWSCPGAWIAIDDEGLYIEVSRFITGSMAQDPDIENEQFDTIMRGVDTKLWDIVSGISEDLAALVDDEVFSYFGDSGALDAVVGWIDQICAEMIDTNDNAINLAVRRRMARTIGDMVASYFDDEDE